MGKTESYRRYSVDLRDDPNAIIALDETITSVMQHSKISLSQALRKIFLAGCKKITEDPEYHAIKSTVEHSVNMSNFFDRINKEAHDIKNIDVAMKTVGPRLVSQIAQECNVDIDQVNDYILPVNNVSQSKYSIKKEWIERFLSDCMVHKVDDVVEAAINNDILPSKESEDFDKEYNSFKQIASTIGASGNAPRGFWRLKEPVSNDNNIPY